ncbi:hypothetical protein HNP87_001370 [Methanococcus maripaludis]|uniref:DUF378 domain-containing protein n=1 Tax=Methanococcus maripaludis TaxID=39152 RepID=A0A7J9PTH5_METMI|nr:DUF378 domain-containing protein [Methanococcus maripaludis]MBA2840838.1 hypothetical protein [Methanococcus maripaludis]MBA2868979.1 hypothetical protein [Methanococcus maripaludis]MBB6401636.1 hypothetical protein [Methanococcus maripaludis]
MEGEHHIEKRPSIVSRTHSRKDALDWVSIVLVIIGGLNWGLVGAFNIDLIQVIFGSFPSVARILYILVGLSAIYMIYYASKT